MAGSACRVQSAARRPARPGPGRLSPASLVSPAGPAALLEPTVSFVHVIVSLTATERSLPTCPAYAGGHLNCAVLIEQACKGKSASAHEVAVLPDF